MRLRLYWMNYLMKTKNNMKKIIRLTESDLISLVKRVINEKKFNNQSEVDRILDKISTQGIDSLTQREKNILDNPDIVSDEPERSDEFYELYEHIKKDLKLITEDFPKRWENVKEHPQEAELFKIVILELYRKISNGIDRLEEMEPDADEVFECNELYLEAGDILDNLFNGDKK